MPRLPALLRNPPAHPLEQSWSHLLSHPWAPLLLLLALLTLRYLGLYLADPALPGNNPQFPAGWWGWTDQGLYLRSAQALAKGRLDAEQHWYPMGYALLGAPFAKRWPMHPFFLVNLVSLLVTAWAFLRFARRVGVRDRVAAGLFLGAVALDGALFRQWVIPWTTSPTTAALWLLLWLAAEHMAGVRRPVAIGALVSAVAVLRPTDLLPALVVLAALGLQELWARRLGAWSSIWRVALGGALVGGAGLALHVAVHGWQASPYMAMSSRLGFSLHAFGWKAFALLVEPRPWWGTGEGLLARHPWMGLALVLLPFAVMRGPAVAALGAAAVAHLALLVAYVDLLPTGLWTFHNVHYVKWMAPGLALLAWVGAAEALAFRRLAAGWRWGAAGLAAGVALLLCVRVMPVPAAGEAAWRGVQLPGPMPGMDVTYFDFRAAYRDAEGEMRNILDMRLYPTVQGARALALRRDFVPPVEGLPAGSRGIVARAKFGMPCWLPGRPRACRVLGGF